MAPPLRSRTLKKNELPTFLKPLKPVLFSESTSRPSPLVQKISSISWSPTGSLLATCTSSSIRVWHSDRPNVKTSIELKNAHPKGGVAFGSQGVSGDVVEKVAFSPTTENVLASSGFDGMVRLWDVRMPSGNAATAGKGTAAADCRVGGEAVFLTWGPNGTEMLVGRKDDVVHSVDVRRITSTDLTPQYELSPERLMEKGSTTYYGMAFSNGGSEVFATTTDGTVQILDYPSMRLLHTLSGHSGHCYAVAHSPTGTHLAVGSADGLISLWDTHTWLSTHSLSAPSQTTSIRDLSFSFDGSYLIAGAGINEGKDGGPGLNIYHVDTGEVVHTLDTTNCPTHVAWHPTRYWIAFAGDPGGLKVLGSGTAL
ncbi:hypothetical protein BAUCODRAFT_118160 [Baudoinia panamericana UAMH 10762]|uniref:Uncharacterized protein n=1 Tax=Baudoinia panamericana (strain UAMH 10762) TaxID=717646 RepID=M2NMG9_BAUPA|nr:uncharacterized protein BAUCODRAFT_118160 [Baudoinia panamericana UAMH 10762]EMD00381.1 hypothetical protein BAUCODRAFT_118160 [Baudoinia panamericana UAMH 10762]